MKYEQTDVAGRVEILANDHFVGLPFTMSTRVGSGGLKAGTPVGSNGEAATDADVTGILLWDVNADNPNGTLVVHGWIEEAKALAHSGVTITSAMKALIPMVSFV